MSNITVKVSNFNGINYPTGCSKEICCDKLEIKGTFWKTPQLNPDGSLSKHLYTVPTAEDGSDQPQDDSYKVVKVDACGDQVEIVIEDNQTAQIVKDACNVCCGDAAVPFTKTIPDVVYEQKPCEDANGDRKISVVVPAGGSLTLAASKDGVPFTVVGNPFASGAAIKTYMSASMTAFGTWSHNVTDNVITLTLDAGVTSAGVTITV